MNAKPASHAIAGPETVARLWPGFWRVFLLLFVPVLLLILGCAWYLGSSKFSHELDALQHHAQLVVALSADHLDDRVQLPVSHLRALAASQAVQVGLDGDSGGMETAFLTLAAGNPSYQQVRWIDETGMERLRVDNVAGQSRLISREALQDKSGRYYFKEAMRLGRGAVYVSPIDLNIEHGVIEQPYKPMLRIATPLQDRQARSRGILIINIAMQSALDAIAAHKDGDVGKLMLLNRDGYWLKSPRPEDEWGFMFGRTTTLRSQAPQVWQHMLAQPAGQVTTPEGLWMWQKVYLARTAELAVTPQYYVVVAHVQADRLAAMRTASWRVVGVFAALTVVLAVALVGWLALALTRRGHAEQQAAVARAGVLAMRELAESQQRFRHVVEASTNGILVVDSGGRIVLANPALLSMFGYSAELLVGQPLEILLPEALRSMHVNDREAYVRAPHTRAMGAGRDLLGQRSDGTQFPVEVGLSSYRSGGETYVLASVVDTSERNRLHEANMRLAAIVNSTQDAIISKTLDGIITSWNPGAEKLFGYRAEEVIGQSIDVLLPPGHRQEERQLLQRIASGETIAHYDTVRLHKDGHAVEISNTITPLRDAHGRIIGASKIARDISLIKQAQAQIMELNTALEQRVHELADANRELDSFAFAVSHDLRAPLRAMSGFSRALLEGYAEHLQGEARTYLEEIGKACQRMGELVEGLLALSRSTRGELHMDSLDISAMAARVRDELTRAEPDRAVAWEIAPQLAASGDARLIENVLRNLMGNAWKYTAGSAAPLIRVYAEERDGARWICVADNGAGFDMRHAAKLYQPFQRLHRQEDFPGLGIGLATVQRIISRHHGALRAQGEPGKGAVFAFTLPPVGTRQELPV